MSANELDELIAKAKLLEEVWWQHIEELKLLWRRIDILVSKALTR